MRYFSVLERSFEVQHFSEPIVSFRVSYLQVTMLGTIDEMNQKAFILVPKRGRDTIYLYSCTIVYL